MLFTTRSHWKLLFPLFVAQIVLLAAHLAIMKWYPDNFQTQIEVIDEWDTTVLHGIVFILELWYVIVPVIRWRTSTFTVTNKRVYQDWGILYRHHREIPLKKVVSVEVERGIIDRIFGCGTLVFVDAAAAAAQETHGAWNRHPGPEKKGVRFHDVPNIKTVKEGVDAVRFSSENDVGNY